MDTRIPAERPAPGRKLSKPAKPNYSKMGHPYCPTCTADKDCPACTAKIDAYEQAVRDYAQQASSVTKRVEILMDAHQLPSADLLFDMLLEDNTASYIWYRAIDWVLWRQANGLPVKRCGDDDSMPAELNARFSAARDYGRDSENWKPSPDGRLIALGRMITEWERTPEEEAEHQRVMEILEVLIERFEQIGL